MQVIPDQDIPVNIDKSSFTPGKTFKIKVQKTVDDYARCRFRAI